VSVANHPPELHNIGPKVVAINSKLSITLDAIDVDGDHLTYSVYGDLPEGASFFKSYGKFEWTPSELTVAFLTFVVTDGNGGSDKETVEITVVSEKFNQKPVFQPVGDQVVEVGVAYTLQLQASDPNGDALFFDTEEPLPAGALLDGNAGHVSWTPAVPQQGQTYEVVFTVTDGTELVSMSVLFHVIAPGQNKPPSFKPIVEQVATAGQVYSLLVEATDPDDDALVYALVDGLPVPDGLMLDVETHTIQWVPTEEQANKTYSIHVSVNDGKYTIQTVIDITVLSTTINPGDCTDDVFEPNQQWQSAQSVTVGEYLNLSICDTPQSPVDVDWYKISMSSGQTLSITLTFSHNGGDLDVHVLVPGSPPVVVASAESASDDELLSFPIPADGLYYIRVVGVGGSVFANPYHMTVSTAGVGCQDDIYENNDSFVVATPLVAPQTLSDTQFCPADRDVYSVPVDCGQDLSATIYFKNVDGNLDLSLYRSSNLDEPWLTSFTQEDSENVNYTSAAIKEDVYVVVDGNPPESTVSAYTLSLSTSGKAVCSEDVYEPNDSKLEAVKLNLPADSLGDISFCCSTDWFFVPLTIGDSLSVDISAPSNAGLKTELRGPDGQTILAEGTPTATGSTIEWKNSPDFGNHYLVLEGAPGMIYNLVSSVQAFDGCSNSKNCDSDTICNVALASCVSDNCTTKDECPSGQSMPCLDGHCADGCTYHADCRLDYKCKGFDVGRYCGNPGSAKTGDPCVEFADCAGASSCPYQDHGGYCTNIGCASNAECKDGGDCVSHGSIQLCAKKCTTNSDCRIDDGYSCQPNQLVNGVPTQVCLPTF